MITYQTTDSTGEFSYELSYSSDGDGFAMDSLSVLRQGKMVFSKRDVTGVYASEAILLAHGLTMCETIANHLRTP